MDHIPYMHCLGAQDACFLEAISIPRTCKGMWAEVWGLVREAVVESLTPMLNEHGNGADQDLKVDRRIEMYFILPFLMLRKSPGKCSSGGAMRMAMAQRLNLFKSGGWENLISDYEADVVQGCMQECTQPSNKKLDEKKLQTCSSYIAA